MTPHIRLIALTIALTPLAAFGSVMVVFIVLALLARAGSVPERYAVWKRGKRS